MPSGILRLAFGTWFDICVRQINWPTQNFCTDSAVLACYCFLNMTCFWLNYYVSQNVPFLGGYHYFMHWFWRFLFQLTLTDSKLHNRYCHIARSSKKLTYEWANYATRNFTIFCSFFSALKREKTSIFQSLEKTNSYQKGLWSYFTHLWKKILDRYRINLLTS